MPTLLAVNQELRPGASLDINFEPSSHTGVFVKDVVELVGELRVNLCLDLFRVLKVTSCAAKLHT